MRVLAVMEQNPRRRAGPQVHIEIHIRPTAGRQHDGAIAGEKRFRRLAVDGHHPGLDAIDFDCNDMALAAIDEPEPEPLV